MRCVKRRTGEYGRFWKADEATGRITRADYWCRPNAAIEQYLASSGGSLPRGAGLPGRVWESGEALWVSDVRNDSRIARPNLAAETGLNSCCVFPIVSEGRTLGVFAFMSREVRGSDPRMLATAAVIGSQVGTVPAAQERRVRPVGLGAIRPLDARFTARTSVRDQRRGNRAYCEPRLARSSPLSAGVSSLRVGEGVNYLHACDRQDGIQTEYARRIALGVSRCAVRRSEYVFHGIRLSHAGRRTLVPGSRLAVCRLGSRSRGGRASGNHRANPQRRCAARH